MQLFTVYLQLSGVAQLCVAISWSVSRMCRLVKEGADLPPAKARNYENYHRSIPVYSMQISFGCCRQTNGFMAFCTLRITRVEIVPCPGFVSVDLTLCAEAASPARNRLLTPGETVGSAHSVQVCRRRPFGLGKVQRCWGVTQTVSTASIFVHHSGLGLLINSARCGKQAAYILRRKIINP